MVLAFHKPYGVLSQFTPDGSVHRTLAEFGFPPDVKPLGRLDADSEGLLLLTDEPEWNARLLHPRQRHPRRYWVQVERIPSEVALRQLARGVCVQGEPTRPCRVWRLEPPPEVSPRDPPIRARQSVPDCWLALELIEGRNRQVRRMTAAIGHPTLRLIRVAIGGFKLGPLPVGRWVILGPADQRRLLRRSGRSEPHRPATRRREAVGRSGAEKAKSPRSALRGDAGVAGGRIRTAWSP